MHVKRFTCWSLQYAERQAKRILGCIVNAFALMVTIWYLAERPTRTRNGGRVGLRWRAAIQRDATLVTSSGVSERRSTDSAPSPKHGDLIKAVTKSWLSEGQMAILKAGVANVEEDVLTMNVTNVIRMIKTQGLTTSRLVGKVYRAQMLPKEGCIIRITILLI